MLVTTGFLVSVTKTVRVTCWPSAKTLVPFARVGLMTRFWEVVPADPVSPGVARLRVLADHWYLHNGGAYVYQAGPAGQNRGADLRQRAAGSEPQWEDWDKQGRFPLCLHRWRHAGASR